MAAERGRRALRRPGDYVPGVDVAGIERVGDAMLAQGLVQGERARPLKGCRFLRCPRPHP
ncbi:hypothetical protein GTW20_22000 [Nocardiopsis alba]|uniref:Uncharacterized protein n=1 Tax=Nocardiopsis alba TaxID=53437 RepID=A0A7K2IYE9_9ACTN|nr:hypothetical protein [Nocardiopsis alba]